LGFHLLACNAIGFGFLPRPPLEFLRLTHRPFALDLFALQALRFDLLRGALPGFFARAPLLFDLFDRHPLEFEPLDADWLAPLWFCPPLPRGPAPHRRPRR